ncbi:MAG: 16S rRNA (uracil(1498)-N(3))-methyltransferase [Sedimentisphaerales bacterium]
MQRFFVSNGSLQGQQVVFTGQQAHQIRNVLRMGPGDYIVVLDNTGCEYTAILSKVERRQVVGELIYKQRTQGEPRTQITLYQALLAREKFEWVLQKCTEVGAARFVPMVTERSIVRRPDTVTARRLSRWRRIITEAAEQSGRGRIPQLEAPVNFPDAVSGLDGFDRCLIGSPQAAGPSLREFLRAGDTEPVVVALLIGPEGGFTDKEVQEACANGAIPISLGRRILRTETAAVVACALILYELGELMPKASCEQ